MIRGIHLRALGVALVLAVSTLAARPVIAEGQGTLRVVAYNIKHGRGMDDQVDLPRIADALRVLNADVITLQEVDRNTERTGRVDQVARLGELLGMRGFHGAHRPYQGGEYGNAVLTRLPVREVKVRAIPPSAGSDLSITELVLGGGPDGRPISVVSVHLAGAPEERRAQADSVNAFYSRVEHPVILAGDFNSRRGDLVMSRLEAQWSVLAKDGAVNTYPSDAPDREIDFVMYRPPGRFEVLEHRVVEETMASDHRPLLAVLRIW